MKTSNVTAFCKLPTCPSAEVLLAFSDQSLDTAKYRAVLEHLGRCEFCSAELHMLAHHPIEANRDCPFDEIPIHLKLLAESILFGERAALDRSFDKDPVTVTDLL
jgi:hypothetical protein